MVRLGQAAMEAALRYFHEKANAKPKPRGATKPMREVSPAWDAFLTAKVFEARGITPPTSNLTDDVVSELFELDPSDKRSRLKVLEYKWQVAANSGRKTVWDANTRGPKFSSSLFTDHDIRNGLLSNAATILLAEMPYRPSKEALTVLLTREIDFQPSATWTDAHDEAKRILGLSTADYDAITDSAVSLGQPLLSTPEWSFAALPAELKPVATTTVQAPARATAVTPTQSAPVELVIESRTERMIRRAVARFPFILLVGPPGTGKGTLVSWITQQVRDDPASFGLPSGFDPDPTWRTPDESWSAFDLIGGLAPDGDGTLKWSPGILPNAVDDDRWLVLDETNRADMDKIMGPLLTWLSMQHVEIGRDAAHGGEPVTLGWADGPASAVNGGTYSAGTAWRLFGTYNPADAQRVFRMGLALSRRFVVIPIPALDPDSFSDLQSKKFPSLDQDLSDQVSGLYTAHYADAHTQLGPAIFLRIAEYVVNPGPSDDPEELLAEAYVMNLGKYIAAYDDAVLDALGTRLADEGAISEDGWTWITSHRNTLG